MTNSIKQNSAKKTKEHEPATELMKVVAMRAPNEKAIKKVFSSKEIEEILDKKRAGESLAKNEKYIVNLEYRRIKKIVRELEASNQSKLIFFPSMSGSGDWYKAVNFSALYYAYRLAVRMGRTANIKKDSDRFLKCEYMVSMVGMEKFTKQFAELETSNYEITKDGIYIFELKNIVSDDEIGQLRRIEETKRDRMRDILKPKAMDPAVYQAIMAIDRELTPRVCKLDTRHYQTIGENVVKAISELLAVYFNYADGITDKEEAGKTLIKLINFIKAGVSILAELRIWKFDTSAAIGENVAHLKRLVVGQFGLNISRE